MSADVLVVKGFKSVGPYRFGMTRVACAEACGSPDSDVFVPGLEVHREVRGRVELEFSREKLNLVTVFRDPRTNVALEGCDVFDPAGLDALRASDPDHKELGAYLHFPRFGVIVGGMGKRRIAEGPLVVVASKASYKMRQRLGAV